MSAHASRGHDALVHVAVTNERLALTGCLHPSLKHVCCEGSTCMSGRKDAALPHARQNKRPQPSQANPSLDRTDDGESAVINLIDAQYLLYAVAKKYRFLSNATLVQQPSEDGASDDIVVRVRVMRPETTGMMVATLVDVDVLMELSSSALIGTELSFSAGGPAAAERSGVLGACRTMLPANLVRHVIMPPAPPLALPLPNRWGAAM